MLRIRLSRTGKTAQESFRITVAEHARAVKRKALEHIGNYNPASKDKKLVVDKSRIEYWIGKGAKPSDSLAVLLKKNGYADMDQYIEPRNKKRVKKGEAKPGATPAA